MGKAAIAFVLAGLAAAGASMATVRAPSAAPVRGGIVAKQSCAPGKQVGQAVWIKNKLIIAGKTVSSNRPLMKGTKVETKRPRGAAEICIKQGDWWCRVRPGTFLRVLPPKQKDVLLYLDHGRVSCSTSKGGGKIKKLRTPSDTLTLGDSTVSLAGRHEIASNVNRGSSVISRGGSVFSLAVTKKQTLVKVRRGNAVVARTGRRRGAVVLGRGQQSLVRAGRDPGPPTAIKLTPAEKAIFKQLETRLPTETDKTPPRSRVLTGPNNPTPERTASFTFTATETDSTFSCALDRSDFRLCMKTEYKNLMPGPHVLLVRATDAAGNTGPAASYSWTITRSAASAIAFATDRDGNFEIYLVNPDRTRRRLTRNPALDDDPAWSPDGTKLAFHSDRDGNFEIWVMDADGSRPAKKLTTNAAIDRNPTWSPDGSQIAFESSRDGNREIYVMNAADGSGQTRLTQNVAEDLDPAWSPNGGSIAFASGRDGNREIYVMNADGSRQRRLTATGATEYNPAWSPGGARLAFHSDRDGNFEIYLMNADGGGQVNVTARAGGDFNPVWSADGTKLAFESDRDSDREIYVMNADGSGQTNLTNNRAAVDQVPDW